MQGPRLREFARLGLLAAVAIFLLHPFATSRMYGAGDALWYANMLADFVTQLRQRVFPIFVGQTEFAFNGAVYPLRVAPMYQHLAGILDLFTGRMLSFIMLQHLTVIVCGVAGIYACYLTLCRIAPDRRWSAAGFAVLYLSCPGLLGTIYEQDLYMTWMTVPLVPLAVYGIVRTFQEDNIVSQVWLAAPLAALWWAHSPIALWFTFITASSQVVRLAYVWNGLKTLKRATIGAVIFAILAQYPFVSVAEIRTPGTEANVVGTLSHPEKLMEFVRGVFPAVLKPLSNNAHKLSDLQLGYSLWAVLGFSLMASFAARRRDLLVLLVSAGFLLILVLPIPGITSFLWDHIPAAVVKITYYWPMQRFYLIVAVLVAASGQIAFESLATRKGKAIKLFTALLFIGCFWSMWESRQFVRAASERTATNASSARLQRPENVLLMDHAYGLFTKVPAYFTDGVVDPRSQVRLISRDSGNLLPSTLARVIQTGRLVGNIDVNPGILDLSPILHIDVARRYQLQFSFVREDVPGILQFVGRSMFREYLLPSSGEAMAFGSGPGNSRSIDLWTTDPTGEDVQIRFIPALSGAKTAEFEAFGSFNLREVDANSEPIEVETLVPFRADVRTEVAALLETPRVFMPGYRASVDGHDTEILKSDQGLASIPVPPGNHTVSLWFVGPFILRLSYWTAICAWSATLLFVTLTSIRSRS